MELNKHHWEQWNHFPEISMEERPLLSSDLEKIVVKTPLPDAFYLKNKLVFRIVAAVALWFLAVYQWRTRLPQDGYDSYQQAALFVLLSYFIYFHVRLLLFADYASLLSLRLAPFLAKIETVLDKFMLSFRILSVIAGFYLLAIFEKILFWWNSGAYEAVSENSFYRWLIIIFLSVSYYIVLLQWVIPKYRKLLMGVRLYRDALHARSQKK
jgi:hypothetical protein